MKLTRKIVVPVLLSLSMGVPALVHAQHQHSADHGKAGSAQSQAHAAAPMADGEVRKVDRDAGKVTIRHGEIRHLDMPPMTMVFQVRDKTLLDNVKVGDKVRFQVVDERGTMIVTAMQPAG
jgi:Cu(I)/Ag(I) efflux system periplasmic protein CusF